MLKLTQRLPLLPLMKSLGRFSSRSRFMRREFYDKRRSHDTIHATGEAPQKPSPAPQEQSHHSHSGAHPLPTPTSPPHPTTPPHPDPSNPAPTRPDPIHPAPPRPALAVAAQLSSTLAALLAATGMRSPGHAWAGLAARGRHPRCGLRCAPRARVRLCVSLRPAAGSFPAAGCRRRRRSALRRCAAARRGLSPLQGSVALLSADVRRASSEHRQPRALDGEEVARILKPMAQSSQSCCWNGGRPPSAPTL